MPRGLAYQSREGRRGSTSLAQHSGTDYNKDPAAVVVDHSGYAVSATEGDHTLIASDDFIKSDVLKVLSASPTTFSANPKSKVTTPPSLTGTSIIQA
ncbi:hypothetical protein glysoja_045110 [Glycine soja]|uniref:Uncharacterized protein n=1 Tax=Glycine soja TaxID=3848 RepID=A0A0B2PUA3_GLYSO|nr:hypothetical protein glysoja_045110 [Glycine soja]